jgi:pimeloyl-ACP methyl ester carboxylesterase
MSTTYQPRRPAASRHLSLRGLNYHLHEWGSAAQATPDRPTLLMVHGWMDVGASFQFVVDALAAAGDATRHIIAPDWRGFGLTDSPGADSYWFPDYLGDLDALLKQVSPEAPVDLLGHSMGGNVVMSYAGVRPQRIRRLVNLEGFGLPATRPDEATERLARWLDQLREDLPLRDYGSVAEVAARLMANNPRLPADKAAWLAGHWARPGADGRWRILGDPAHRRTNPVLYQVDEVLATWHCITAPLLWIEGSETRPDAWWQGRYTRAEFGSRLAVVPDRREAVVADAGHMLHHDQPEVLAGLLQNFLAPPHLNRGVGG